MTQKLTLPEEQETRQFNMPIQGHSLTTAPGSMSYEQPPQFTDPDEAVDFIVDKLMEPENQARFQKLMFAGTSVEEITNTIALGGFTGGVISPDVAEIIKTPIAMVLVNMALEAGIPVQVFKGDNSIDEASGIDDETTMKIMADRNPDRLNKILQELNAETQFKKGQEKKPMKMAEGFIEMKEPVEEEKAEV